VLHLHRAERADRLVDALGELLSDPPDDPFAPEVIAVPTRGMERWLTQRLSGRLGVSPGRRDGICANVDFPSPHRLVADAVAVASGVDPDQDPWRPERMAWRLLGVVDECLGEPWLAALSDYLGHGSDSPDPPRHARRFRAVRHLAELFDRYALYRPEMVGAWAGGAGDAAGTGASGGSRSAGDEAGAPRANGGFPVADAAWQAELWRRLRARIDLPGPAERLTRACAQLREHPSTLELPARISLFGLTRLPAGHLQVLRALGAHRDVHLFLLHPSPALWRKVTEDLPGSQPITRRAQDRTGDLPANRLLASWGRDAREMQLVLAAAGEHLDHHHALVHPTATLLQRIQSDIHTDGAPAGVPFTGQLDTRPRLEPGDRSVQVHACHGRARQVEVIREAILHLLAQNPTLEPRDVIVMCPDIEAFAPLIQATFGASEVASEEEDDERDSRANRPKTANLRVRLADRSLRQTNPVLGVVAQLLELGEQRLTASQILDLADREAVRHRFGLDDDELGRLAHWVTQAGIRWGLDGAHRAPFKLEQLDGGTWRFGLDRLLLGVTMTEDGQRLFEGVLPVDDVESGAIDLAGRLAELIARVQSALDQLSTPQPIDAWARAIGAAADSLTRTGERELWQRFELQRLLDEMVEQATVDGSAATVSLAPAEIRALLGDRLQGRPTRTNFRTGHLTVCTLVPMRSVPHRVVCLLGLDDGAFPRKAPRDGDDLMLADGHVGERDPRSEDRQLLLDALLAASQRLIITYTGNDERTNAPRPPAVPVGELLDVVDATVCTGDGRPARAHVVVRHPLQPFDPRNFTSGALAGEPPWSFDPVTLEGARALSGPRAQPGPFLPAPLPAPAHAAVELSDLVRFAQHPVRAFLRQRLRISLSDRSDETEDGLSVELDGLARWAVGQRLLDARLAGVDGRAAIRAEIARGMLPPGVLGKPVIDRVYPIVGAIADQAAQLSAGAPRRPVDVRTTLAGGRLLNGTVAGVCGDLLLTSTYSRLSGKHRLAAWVSLLALTAAHPQRPFRAATIGRKDGRGSVLVAQVAPLADDPDERREIADRLLAAFVDLYDRGMREPLPLYCLTSAAYAEAAVAGGEPLDAGRRAWTSEWKFDKEDRELEHQLVLGGVLAFEQLSGEPPRPDEVGPGWDAAETTRLGRYARRLWDELLAHEQVTSS
jgi:exodeoxyribonuclease V gamma subunit